MPQIACSAIIVQCLQNVVTAFNTAQLVVLQVEHCSDVCEATIVSTRTIDCIKLFWIEYRLMAAKRLWRVAVDTAAPKQKQYPCARALVQPVCSLQHIDA